MAANNSGHNGCLCFFWGNLQDPFIPIAHGQKCAAMIPNADSLWIEGMGHDIPNELIEVVSSKIIANF